MDFQGALEYLNKVEARGIHLGLKKTQTLLDHLPKSAYLRQIPVIQVAGTNGKGSTAHFLTSILQHAGYKTGLFTSPHLNTIRERISINNQWITEHDLAAGLNTVKKLSQEFYNTKRIEHLPTYFEQVFLTAVDYFSRQTVDAAILEVGLGGRWDATSVVKPAVSVITTIARDHTSILGRRIRDIAAEKAGIIKSGVPVVCGCNVRSTAHRVIKETALEKNAPFFNVIDTRNRLEVQDNSSGYDCTYSPPEASPITFELRSKGSHQAANAAAAIKALLVLNSGRTQSLKISRQAIGSGLSKCIVPGRIEVLETKPRVILDAGHNVQSVTALTNYLNEQGISGLTLVFGVLADKNYRKIAAMLKPFANAVVLADPLSRRALPAAKLIPLFRENGGSPAPREVTAIPCIKEAIAHARKKGGDILITGSFYLVGEARRLILDSRDEMENIQPEVGEKNG